MMPFTQEYDLVKDGVSLVTFRSMVKTSRKMEASVTSHPVEEGSFTSVNKVVEPQIYEARLGFVGTDAEMAAVVAILEAELVAASLVQIVSPLGTSPEATITKLSYAESVENGRGGLFVDVTLEEIKQVSPNYTDTDAKPIKKKQAANASDVSNTDSGKQQTKEPSPSLLSKLFS